MNLVVRKMFNLNGVSAWLSSIVGIINQLTLAQFAVLIVLVVVVLQLLSVGPTPVMGAVARTAAFAWFVTAVSPTLEHYQATFHPLLYGVVLATVLTLLLKETGIAPHHVRRS